MTRMTNDHFRFIRRKTAGTVWEAIFLANLTKLKVLNASHNALIRWPPQWFRKFLLNHHLTIGHIRLFLLDMTVPATGRVKIYSRVSYLWGFPFLLTV